MSFSQLLKAALTDLHVSSRNVLRHGRRSAGGALAVTFGTIALLLAAGFIEWIFWGMREGAIRSGLGHIQLVKAGYLERGMADPPRYLLAAQSPEKDLLLAAQHMVKVAGRVKFAGLISTGDSTLSFLGTGLDPVVEGGSENFADLEGQPLSMNEDKSGILVGKGLADNLGVKVGQKVVLLTNAAGGVLSGAEATVRGVFVTTTKAYDDMAVHLPLALAGELLQTSGVHMWVGYLDRTENTAQVVHTLRQQLMPSVEVVPWYDVADFYNKTVRLFSRQVFVMKVIIALVVILSISNMMMMTVMARIDEIATSMALGVRRARVLSRFLIEGVLIGAMGGLAGVALGSLLATAISAVGIPMPPPPGMARGFTGEIRLTLPLILDALTLAFTTALIASIYPAWRASRMVIADALRHGH